MDYPVIERGQVYVVDLGRAMGREQAGRRPVVVVSANAINRQPLVVTIVAGTSAENITKNFPTNVRITAGEGGLDRETVFLCFQLRSLDPRRFPPAPIGRLSPVSMEEMDRAVRLSLKL